MIAVQEHITSLPADVLSTPMGQMLAPMLTGESLGVCFHGSVHQRDKVDVMRLLYLL